MTDKNCSHFTDTQKFCKEKDIPFNHSSCPEQRIQDGILLPWQPESHPPLLPFVICTNGEGHYWIGRHIFAKGIAEWWDEARAGSWNASDLPLAWIEPEKFVPFVKTRQLHKCDNGFFTQSCYEDFEGDLYFTFHTMDNCKTITKVNFCPLCGYKAGEK